MAEGLTSATTDDWLEDLDELREIHRHRVPDDLKVHVEVRVYQAVPHRDDMTPRDDGVGGLRRGRRSRGCLADDLDVLDDGQDQHASRSRSSRERPAANDSASRAASNMWRTRIASSATKLDLGAREDI